MKFNDSNRRKKANKDWRNKSDALRQVQDDGQLRYGLKLEANEGYF